MTLFVSGSGQVQESHSMGAWGHSQHFCLAVLAQIDTPRPRHSIPYGPSSCTSPFPGSLDYVTWLHVFHSLRVCGFVFAVLNGLRSAAGPTLWRNGEQSHRKRNALQFLTGPLACLRVRAPLELTVSLDRVQRCPLYSVHTVGTTNPSLASL